MSIIEEKGVKFTFDNSQFESAAAKTIETLKNLAGGMNLLESTKALVGLQGAINSTSFEHLLSGVDSISNRFSVMGEFVHNELYKLVDTAANAGKRLASELTTVPIKSGLQEYETQIGAVQTIWANTSDKGTTIKEINAALDELNTYADKTIYNFTEMTRNIGTFTAAGLDLQTSTSAIQGIANLAAMSGSTAQQASTAMYQLSQALSSGTVKLQDWNSVVNASMGGAVFQKALQETSKECVNVAKRIKEMSEEEQKAYQKEHHYTDDQMKSVKEYSADVDAIIKKEGTFRESLSSGWITSDVLARTLNKFTKSGAVEYVAEMAGVSEKSVKELQRLGERAGFDSVEFRKMALSLAKNDKAMSSNIQKTLKMANNAEDAATKVKTFSQLIDTLKEALQSGWSQSWRTILGDFEETRAFWTNINNVLSDEISASADARNAMLDEWSNEGGRDAFVQSVYNMLDGIVNIKHEFTDAMNDIFEPITGKQLSEATKKFQAFTENFKSSTMGTNVLFLSKAFKAFFSLIDIGVIGVKNLASKFTPLFAVMKSADTKPFLDTLERVFEKISLIDGLLRKGWSLEEIINPMIKDNKEMQTAVDVMNSVVEVLEKISEKAKEGLESVKKFFETISKGPSYAMDQLKNSKLVESLLSVRDFILSIFSGIGTVIGNLVSTVKDGFVRLLDSINLDVFGETLSSQNLGEISLLILAMSKALNSLNENNSVGGLFGNLANTIGNFSKAIKRGLEVIDDTMEPITRLFDGLRVAVEAWKTNLQADTLSKIAKSLLILAAALLVLSAIDETKMQSSFTTMATMFGELFGSLIIFSRLVNGENVAALAILGTIASSVARGMLILSIAMKVLSSIDTESLTQSTIALGAVMGYLLTFAVVTADTIKDGRNFAKGIKSLTKIAVATLILVAAIKLLSGIETSKLWEGLIAVEVLLGTLGGITKLMSGTKSPIGNGVGFILIASSLLILYQAIKKFGELPAESLDQGVFAVIGVLVAMSATLFAGNFTNNMITMSASLLIVSAAMIVVAKAVKTMGEMDPEELGRGFLAFAGALLALTVAVEIMQGNLAGAGAFLIMAVAIIPLAMALKLLSTIDLKSGAIGLGILAGALIVLIAAGTFALPAAAGLLALGAALIVFSVGMIALGVGLTGVSAGLMAFVAAIPTALRVGIASFPLIMQAIGAFLDSLATLIPKIVLFGINLIVAFVDAALNTLINSIGVIADFLVQFFGMLEQYAPPLVMSALRLMLAFMNGLADGIRTYAPLFMEAIKNLLEAAIELVLTLLGELANVIPGIGPIISGGLEDAKASIREFMLGEDSKSVGSDTVNAIASGVAESSSELESAGTQAGSMFTSGLENEISTGINLQNMFDSINGDEGTPVIQEIASNSANTFNESFASNIQTGTGLQEVFSQINETADMSGAGEQVASTFTSGFENKITTGMNTEQIFANMSADMGGGILQNQDGVNQAIQTIADGAVTTAESNNDSFKTTGTIFDDNLASGVLSNQGKVTTAGSTAGKTGSTGAKTTQTNWYSSGGFLVDGMVSGIDNNKWKLYAAGKRAGERANQGAKDATDEHSPSKVWYGIGAFMIQGAVNAMTNLSGLLESAAFKTGTNASDSFGEALTSLNDAIQAPEDPSMSIKVTPVLDRTAFDEQLYLLKSSLSDINMDGKMSIDMNFGSNELRQLVANTNSILAAVRSGSDLYIDDNVLIGRINRKLGALI